MDSAGGDFAVVSNSKNPMKTMLNRGISSVAAAVLLGLAGAARAQSSFGVTTPSSSFQFFIDGVNNTGQPQGFAINNSPPLTLTAGQTYTFNINTASIHPMEIVTSTPSTGTAPHYTNASPLTISSGPMTLIIPATNFPTTLYYECSQHFFYGVITVVAPVEPAPPSNHIISIVLTPTTVTMTSDGTNTTYNLVPQFDSNIVDGNWQDVTNVTGVTNIFSNGTNTTTFNRLDSVCGSNVFLRISQRPP
jgi:hypothetical protein